MVYSVQRLLEPREAGNPLADCAISMPEELRQALRHIFAFDIGGSNELEGDKIFRAMCRLHDYMEQDGVCIINFRGDELPEDIWKIQALAPIEKAEDVITFIENQLSNHPKELAVPSAMKSSLNPSWDNDILGWFDLDTPSFIFKDNRPLDLTCRLMGKRADFLPTIDRVMDYDYSVGDIKQDAIKKMTVLAKIWGRTITKSWNIDVITVSPEGAVTLTPKVS